MEEHTGMGRVWLSISHQKGEDGRPISQQAVTSLLLSVQRWGVPRQRLLITAAQQGLHL